MQTVCLQNVVCLFVLFDLILYVPSTIFQLNRCGSSLVEQVLSRDNCLLLKDHNAVAPVRHELAASRSRAKLSTTEPLCPLQNVVLKFGKNETYLPATLKTERTGPIDKTG